MSKCNYYTTHLSLSISLELLLNYAGAILGDPTMANSLDWKAEIITTQYIQY